MTAKFSRRDFLRMAALAVGAVVAGGILEACKSLSTLGPVSSPSRLPAASLPPTAAETLPASSILPVSTLLPSSTPSASAVIPDLVVARNGDPEVLVRRAIAALGGMERFVTKGASVIVKPNICVSYRTYEYAATTNPWVVGTLVKMAFEAGAGSVKVLDYPYGGAAAEAYTTSGIQQQVKAAGGQMVVMSSRKYVSTRIPAGKWLKRTDVYDEILKADVLINAPIAKHHSSARVTAAMKNLMGVVKDRSAMHGNLGQAIADLNTLIKSDLTVIDGVRILKAHGPAGGRLGDVKKLNTVVASTDIVAADSYAAGFFGLKPNDLAYVKIGAAMGLGRSDLSKLRIEEFSV
jgi:uncharacterized protein (DUF362 family)